MSIYFKEWLASSVAVSAVAIGSAAWAQTKTFDVPAQAAETGVAAFARQADVQALISATDARGKRTNAVRGAFTAQAALQRLLADTGLKAQSTGPSTFVVVKAPVAVAQATDQGDAPLAAESEDNLAWVDEVIVTATKRSASVLTVPLSISAVSGQTIEQMGAKDAEELSRAIPGLSITGGNENNDKTFIIRGVGAAEDTAATVAVYLDDTPLTVGLNSPDLKLFDIERVEVLRGPQGTLFGSSAMGGAIRYVTPAPNFDRFTARAKGEVSSTGEGGWNYEAQGAAGGPISERLAFRASGFFRRDAGYIDLVDEDTRKVVRDDVNSAQTWGGRLVLGARVTDTVDATASVLFQDARRYDFNQYFTATGASFDTAEPLGPLQKTERSGNDSRDRFVMPNLVIKADLGFADLTSSTSYLDRRVRINNDFSHFFEGFFVNGLGLPEDADTRALSANNRQDRNFTATVQELRLTSKSGGAFEWLVGAYYRQSKNEELQDDTSPNVAAYIAPIFGAPLEDFAILYKRTGAQQTTQFAAFGEATYTFAKTLKLTAGLRVTSLKVKRAQVEEGAFAGATPVREEIEEHPVTPKFSAAYMLSPDAMVYATAAKGFREGGPNGGVPSFCDAELAALGLDHAPASFKSDGLWSYEAGTKFKAFHNRLRVQAAAYRIDWKDIQQTLNLASCGYNFTANVGQARVQGVELEASLHPVDALTLDFAAGYVDAVLSQDFISGTDENGDPVIAARKGTQLIGAPDFTFNASARWDFPLNGEWNGYVRGEYSYIGEAKRHLNTPSDLPQNLVRKAYDLVSLRAAVSNGRYEFSVFADNLFDSRPVIIDAFFAYNPWGGEGLTTLRPRTIGVSASAKF
jgi:iron complex outermembrane receptor protein